MQYWGVVGAVAESLIVTREVVLVAAVQSVAAPEVAAIEMVHSLVAAQSGAALGVAAP